MFGGSGGTISSLNASEIFLPVWISKLKTHFPGLPYFTCSSDFLNIVKGPQFRKRGRPTRYLARGEPPFIRGAGRLLTVSYGILTTFLIRG